MPRTRTLKTVETQVLVQSARWCALCFGLQLASGPRKGQIAHVDRNSSNGVFDNLCWLCLEHHDEYDSTPRQSKGLTPAELRHHRENLYRFLEEQRARLMSPPYLAMSPEALVLAEHLNSQSRSGRRSDAQVRIDSLGDATNLSSVDIEVAIDELEAGGLVAKNGTGETIFATNRFFWETDPLFRDNDPASDAVEVARLLVAHSSDQFPMADLAAHLSWDPRRLNPATTYLRDAGFIQGTPTMGGPFWTVALFRTASTKRFVRDLDRARSVRG